MVSGNCFVKNLGFKNILGWTAFVQPPLQEWCRNYNKIMTTNNQLELGFNGTQCRIHGRKRETRMARGQWWFARMREVVNQAMDLDGGGAGHPEQIWMPGANRQFKA